MLQFRILRDKGRILAILNRMTASIQSFDSATSLLPPTSIKLAKLLYLKGLASKRISSSVSIGLFEESLAKFSQILGTTQNYFITQAIFEIG
jgi:hypothetical protein